MDNCQDRPTFFPEALWKALMNLPALRYMKAPVNTEAELYEKYPVGNEKGTFAFVHNENTFYTYHPRGWHRGEWKPISANSVSSFFEIDAEFLKEGDILVYDSNKKKFVVKSGNVWNKLLGDLKDTFSQVTKFLNQVDEIPTQESDSGIYFVHKDENDIEFRALYIVLGKKAIKIFANSDYYNKESVESMLEDERYYVDAQIQRVEENITNLGIRKTYPSYAAMQADVANPIGDDGQAIRGGELVMVVNLEDSSKDGVYRYKIVNSTKSWEYASGIGIVGELNAKADIRLTDNRYVIYTDNSGNRIPLGYIPDTIINEIFTVTRTRITITSYTVGAITKNGTGNIDANYKRTSVVSAGGMLSIRQGFRHFYSGTINNSQYAGVAYFDANLAFIGYECGEVKTYDNYELSIPVNAKYIATCANNADPYVSFGEFIGKLTDTNNKIISINDFIEFVSPYLITYENYINLITAFAIGALTKNGTINSTYTDYKRSTITNPASMGLIHDGLNHFYTGEIDHDLLAGIIYFDENLVFLGYECGDIRKYENYTLNPPANAKYIASCSKGGDPKVFAASEAKSNIVEKNNVVDFFGLNQEKIINQKTITEQFFDEELKRLITGFAVGATLKTGIASTSSSFTNYFRSSVTNTAVMGLIENGKTYTYSGQIDDARCAGVVYYDENVAFVGYECGDVQTYENFMLTPPANAKYIGGCGANTEPIISSAQFIPKASFSSSSAIYIDKNSTTSLENGSKDYPYKDFNTGFDAFLEKKASQLVIAEGDYRVRSIKIGSLTTGNYKITSRFGKQVRLLGSDKLEGWTKTAGQTNVYEKSFTGTIPDMPRMGGKLLYEDGNPSKLIEARHYHPLQKNLTYRLPFTAIYPKDSITEVDANAGTYFYDSVNGKLYIHTSNSDDPVTNGFSYENMAGSVNTVVRAENQKEVVNLEMENIQFMYYSTGFNTNGLNRNVRRKCSAIAVAGAGAWQNSSGYVETWFEEAAFCNNDGENSHFSGAFSNYATMPDNRSHYPVVVHYFLWTHDNGDDGESSHENHMVILIGCLHEFNGDSGSRPSNDATYYAYNCIFRGNGWEVTQNWTLITPNRGGEGFAVVNPTISSYRIGCRATLFCCVFEENNVGLAAISQAANYVESIQGISRNNKTEIYAASGAKVVLRNHRASNPDPDKIIVKVSGGEVEVLFDEVLKP